MGIDIIGHCERGKKAFEYKFYTFVANFFMGTEIELFDSSELTRLCSYLWGWIKNVIYKRKVNTRDKLLARI